MSTFKELEKVKNELCRITTQILDLILYKKKDIFLLYFLAHIYNNPDFPEVFERQIETIFRKASERLSKHKINIYKSCLTLENFFWYVSISKYKSININVSNSRILINSARDLIINCSDAEVIVLGSVKNIKIKNNSKNIKLIVLESVKNIEIDKNTDSNFIYVKKCEKITVNGKSNKLIIENVKTIEINSNNNNVFIYETNLSKLKYMYYVFFVLSLFKKCDDLKYILLAYNSLYELYFKLLYNILRNKLNIESKEKYNNNIIHKLHKYCDISKDEFDIKFIIFVEKHLQELISKCEKDISDTISNYNYRKRKRKYYKKHRKYYYDDVSYKQIPIKINGSNNIIFSIHPLEIDESSKIRNKIIDPNSDIIKEIL